MNSKEILEIMRSMKGADAAEIARRVAELRPRRGCSRVLPPDFDDADPLEAVNAGGFSAEGTAR